MPLSSGHCRVLVTEVTFPEATAVTVVVADDDGGVEVGVSIIILLLAVIVEIRLLALSHMLIDVQYVDSLG